MCKPCVLWLWFFQSRHRFLSSCRSSSSVIALLVVWSDHLSVCKNLRSFVEASDGLWYTNKQIVWDRYPISLFFWENWTFFANFLEKNCCFDTGLLRLFLAYGWYAAPITTQVPLAIAHPVWSRFWSFEVIISACTRIWEVSWTPAISFVEASDGLQYTKNQIVLDGCPISQFFGKIGPFLPLFWKQSWFWLVIFALSWI